MIGAHGTDVGIVGGSGFTGAELLRLLAGHPELRWRGPPATPRPAPPVAALYPSLAAAYPDLVFDAFDPAMAAGLDLVFLALPHGASQRLVPELRAPPAPASSTWPPTSGCRTRPLYPRWYGEDHPPPSCSPTSSTACPSCSASDIVGADAVAAARLLPDGRRPGPGPAGAGRA